MVDQIQLSHYKILGLRITATKTEVTSAYKKAARKYHPDKAGPDGAAMFIKCRDAFEFLLPRVAETHAAEPKDNSEQVDSAPERSCREGEDDAPEEVFTEYVSEKSPWEELWNGLSALAGVREGIEDNSCS
jgi:DnaJ-class molecular chaperone